MSMTGSMCVSMTGRPTHMQIANEQRRQSYGYYQVAKATKTGLLSKQNECSVCPYWKDTETESGCSAPYRCGVIGR